MKKNRIVIVGMIGLLMALGLALAGCDDKSCWEKNGCGLDGKGYRCSLDCAVKYDSHRSCNCN
ncbi:MAG: hypothetical protein LBD48_08075 [Treponema sp.]|nr:hypothetical protein [Treponema sp.]